MAGDLGTISGQVRLNTAQAVAAYAALRAQNARTVYALRGMGDSFVGTGKVMGGVGLGLVAVFAKAASAAAEFERKMDFFAAVTDTSSAKMQELSKFTLQLATDTIYSADQIAEGFIELGKAGVSAEQIIGGIGEAMANLGAAGDIPLAESGQIITSTIQQFDLAASDAVGVVDLLAGAANASIADITDIGVSLKYVGGVANAAGLTFEDTATAISLLAKAGIRGSTAGTSLRQMIVSLPGATKPAHTALRELGIITGENNNKFYDQAGNLKPLAQVFQILQKHTEGLTNKQKLMYLRTIFNNRALSAASILTREGAAGFREMNAAMSKVSAAEVAHDRLDNLSGDIEILRGNIETLVIQAGGPFQEMLRGWVQNLTQVVQAFGNLSPGAQKAIVQVIGLSGVILTAGGAFLIFVGTLFRMAAAALKFGAAILTIIKWVRGFLFVIGLITGGAISVPFLLIAAAVAAVVAAFVLAYKKITPFRELVDKIASSFMDAMGQMGEAIGQLIGWFGRLDLSSVWSSIVSGVTGAVSAVGSWFSRLGSMIMSGLGNAAGWVGQQVGRIVSFFASLPGRVVGIVSGFVSRVTSLLTFRNIGFAIGFMVGTVIRLWVQLVARVIGLAIQLVTRVGVFFAQLPGRVAGFVSAMVGRAIALFSRMRAAVVSAVISLVARVLNFFAQLPGRVANFVSNMVSRGINLFNNFRTALPRLASQAVSGVTNFISQLPGRVAAFLGNMVGRARTAFSNFVGAARDFGNQVQSAISSGLEALPGLVSGVVGRMISAFRGAISSAIGAVRDFAAGMWKGFKEGLGISSPSYIEEAIWQITGVVGEETKKLSRQVMDVQKLSKNMAATEFSIGGTSGSKGYVGLASDQAANRKRAQTLMSASLTSPTPADRAGDGGPKASELVSGVATLHPDSTVTIRGVVQEVVDDNSTYDGVTDRMGGI